MKIPAIKAFVIVGVAAFGLATCSEGPVTVDTPQMGSGVSNPIKGVTGAFAPHTASSLQLKAPGIYTRGSGKSAEVYYCDGAGAKFGVDKNGVRKNQTGTVPHQHCIAG